MMADPVAVREAEGRNLSSTAARADFRSLLERIGYRGEVSYVYRLYDDRGTLLYVGSTTNLRTRLREHFQQKPWFAQEVARLEYRMFRDRDRAFRNESEAIYNEDPVYNEVGRKIDP